MVFHFLFHSLTVVASSLAYGRGSINAHVLDISHGRGAGGVEIVLYKLEIKPVPPKSEIGEVHQERQLSRLIDDRGELVPGAEWIKISKQETQASGRTDAFPLDQLKEGFYKLKFYTAEYFGKQGQDTFFPWIEVPFRVKPGQENEDFHVPITLSPFGYSTYRGV